MVCFEQTHVDNGRQISGLINRVIGQAIMTVPKNDKFKDYARYAEHCLNMVAATRDQEFSLHPTRDGRRMAETSGYSSAPS